ncbi:hypothetical protein SELR_pSRC300240 (plasmid) [Selenomonas ruminantium subsp. lactilytica TAM6421]|uniref:Uncharacterized protein n=1 Tax=Selenomonas ruminantium subsp. lactilytica (strain NBRC 103574 / TAM6421) TaxID=927704 RepID=I0GWG0_SELRL|nr:hypothetical protein [Selenomonas ruminantium]BAL85097.1 hypothetical protein SELR_pSRC300240 [Selenomonas ruminantium subsp. lactilytica TAM6421]
MENMNNVAIVNEIKGKLIGAEQILFLLNQNGTNDDYEDVIEIVRNTLSDAMELTDKIL